MVIRADERTEPGLVQRRQLRCEPDQGIDEENLLELLGPVTAGDQQVAYLVLRVQQHDADGVQQIGLAQPIDHGAQQLRQAVGPQQRQFPSLRALHDRLVIGGLGGQFQEALLELVVLPDHIIHVLSPLRPSARARRCPHIQVRPAANHEGGEFRGIPRLDRGN